MGPFFLGHPVHLVQTALNLSSLDAGILIMVQQASLMMFSLTMVAWSNLVPAPVPFGFRSYWDFVGVGLGIGGFRTKGLGTGLDNNRLGH